MEKTKPSLLLAIKSFFIGIAVLIPGLSGGSAAVMLGVYDQILESTANLFKNFKKNIIYLMVVGIGGVAGLCMLIYVFPISKFSEENPNLSKIIFCIITVISLILFIKKSIIGKFIFKDSFFILAGGAACLLFSFLIRIFSVSFDNNIFLIPIGILLATALVLPGISFSFMLYFFGIYEDVLKAAENFDIVYLSLLAVGIIAGIFISAKVIMYFINKFPKNTYLVITGFVICSIIDIFAK